MARSRKSASRVTQPASPKRKISAPIVRSHERAAVRPGARASSKVVQKGTTSGGPQSDVPYQNILKDFETGVRAFQGQDYRKAAEVFEKLVDSNARDIAERAQVHLRLCRQRMRRPAPSPKSADEHYAVGVACLNARNLGLALEHLSKADKLKANQDHIRYALAVLFALEGKADVAFAHLEAAFALRPENRFHARRDEDFQGIAADPRFRRLIYSAGIR